MFKQINRIPSDINKQRSMEVVMINDFPTTDLTPLTIKTWKSNN